MLDLDAIKKKGEKIKIGGEVYDLAPPDLDAMISVSDMEKLSSGEQLSSLKDFLHGCGLPKKVSGKLDGDQIKALSDHLQGGSKKK